MLIPFPFGLLGTAAIFDIVYLIWGNPTMVTVSYWMILAGIISGLVAALSASLTPRSPEVSINVSSGREACGQ